MYFIYSFFYFLAVLVLLIPQYLRRPAELRKRWLSEKFGSYAVGVEARQQGPIWVHAVSVGEVNASLPLLRKLREIYPGLPFVLSTVTDTGRKVAEDRAPAGTRIIYLPLDLVFAVKRALDQINPILFVTIETEIWPNIFRVMAERGIPVFVLNGRISERSSRGYARVPFFMRKVLGHVRAFGMQGRIDAERLLRIGANAQKIKVLGNFKFDIAIPEGKPAWTEALAGPIIVAGSTHRGEERIMIEAYKKNLEWFPGLKLVLAPRHPERFGEVEDLLRSEGVPFLKRSELGAGGTIPGTFTTGVILLNVMGELSAVYGIADVAIIGKSFTGHGGQNPLEAAYWGRAIICGSHMENFPFMKDFYEAGAAFEVDEASLAKKVKEFLLSPEKARDAGSKARELCLQNSGAVERAVEMISGCLPR